VSTFKCFRAGARTGGAATFCWILGYLSIANILAEILTSWSQSQLSARVETKIFVYVVSLKYYFAFLEKSLRTL
jgi:hypothetical protein